MDNLAVDRAVLAAMVDSAKNSAPIQPEDRQPNESLRRRRGAGPPTVVPMSRGRGGGMQGKRKYWDVNHQRNWNSSHHWKPQDYPQRYGGSNSWPSSQPANSGTLHSSSNYPFYNTMSDNHNSSANRDLPSTQSPARRGRPLPLPPRQDNSQSDAGNTTVSIEKPYSNNLPALKPRPSFPGIIAMRTSKSAPTARRSFSPGVLKVQHEKVSSPRASLERDTERSSSPKRRKIDTTPPELTGGDVSSNDSAQAVPPPELQVPDDDTSIGVTIQPLATPSQSKKRTLVPSTEIKSEPESPSLIEDPLRERRMVTAYVTRFSLPENCKKTNSQWQTNRKTFRKEKTRELKQKGLDLIGRCMIREDGMCIEWKSTVPVWCDTLEPVSFIDIEKPNSDYGSPRPRLSTPRHSPIDNIMDAPVPCPTMNVVERPSSASPPNSPGVSQQKVPITPLDVRQAATVSASPPRSDVSKKSRKSHIPRGSLDLATAIEISQRTNATPSKPQSRRPFISSSATFGSPSALMTPCSSYRAEHPDVTPLPAEQPVSRHPDANLSEEEADWAVPDQSRIMEAIKAGWTVMEDVCQNSDKGGSEEVENNFDELVEESEPKERKAVREPDQVESLFSSAEDTVEDDDTLTRNFINGYMQLFETDRNSLVSLYAPDAILRYRLLDVAQSPSALSPHGLSSFPFLTARGHKQISSSLLTHDHIHFYQKVDEDGKTKIDLEYHRERTDNDNVSLYVRSSMTIDEEVPGINEHQNGDMGRQQKRLVDHDFWLCRDENTRSRSAITEGHSPFLIRSHLIIMHEAPL